MTPGAGFDLRLTRPLDAFDLTMNVTTPSPCVGVVGPSGSGKSTLVRVLAGVDRGAVGRVEVAGVAWQAQDPDTFIQPWRRQVGWVPQDVLLFPHLTVKQNLQFSARAGPSAPPLESVIEMLEIEPLLERHSREISGGERQRVAIGRALLSAPRLLLLDEPFSALDEDLRARVVDRIEKHIRERELSLLLVTHDQATGSPLVDHWWSLSRGVLTSV